MAPIRKGSLRVSRRIKWLSKPRKSFSRSEESTILLSGVRKSALKSILTERVLEASYPCIRHLIATQERYGHVLNNRCKAALTESIENANGTVYARISKHSGHSNIDNQSLVYKKKCLRWTEDLWNQHLQRLEILARPRAPFHAEIKDVKYKNRQTTDEKLKDM